MSLPETQNDIAALIELKAFGSGAGISARFPYLPHRSPSAYARRAAHARVTMVVSIAVRPAMRFSIKSRNF